MPRYNPEDANEVMFDPGVYDAVVKHASEGTSKSGNDMIKLILTVYGPKGETDVFDYLVFSEAVLYKVKHFCESAGIDFGRGVLDESDCLDKNVKVKLVIDENEGYAPKNAVKDYVKRSVTAPFTGAAPKAPEVAKPNDPLVPF